ncbi:MAG: DNA cytosine methyltransferase [Mesorhizobium sp.]|uniref:DNA cytosine methyltransferase n=1 Tax=Mesorhizobium sp. TaxID=1871066 RepID=UPI000FE87AA2|nr:DNA cytosine methyltransferase [Mesorhizobium sp.]RWO96204.1 MAG: DNA cytosine methyltransferase [Mesorhizobium sp.]TIM51296.1 MAG: DNA cytosine methyltransferase [Mesorhizobium sp.]
MLNCIDLFAGAGGFSLSAGLAGLRVRLAIENDVHAVRTFRRNICLGKPNPPLVVDKDILTLSPAEVRARSLRDREKCDLLLGGPPCQGFSTHRIKGAGIDDARNKLIHTYFEFVRTFQPTAFLMENVPGMLWPRHSDYLRRFFQEGAEAGYQLFNPIVLDARDFGIPQRRKRVFILGVKAGLNVADFVWPPKATHGNEAAIKENPDLLPWVACSNAFDRAPDNDLNDVHMSHSEELIAAFRRTPANGGSRKDSGRLLKCHDGHDGHRDVYGRINPALPGPTMTTACINPSKGRFVHPTEHHGITARQAARLQTFPDTFVFEGGLMAAGQQIGNAVPIMLGKTLIQHILPLLDRQGENAKTIAQRKMREIA